MSADTTTNEESVRADVWLWAVRLFKTRSLSAEACKAGRIRIQGQPVKPARQVRGGDILEVEKRLLVQTCRVREVLTRRVGARLVDQYLEDLTSEETYREAAAARRAIREAPVPVRSDGSGRPTKKERRELEEIMTESEDRDSFYRKLDRNFRNGAIILLALLTCGLPHARTEEAPQQRRFTTAPGAPTFKITENLHVTAKNLAPETDKATGAFKGMSATGRVLIKVRPDANEEWILVSCGKATYDPTKDEILLTRFPSVKARGQVLRATSEKTVVRVARKTGKWEIDGPHKLELNLDAFKRK